MVDGGFYYFAGWQLSTPSKIPDIFYVRPYDRCKTGIVYMEQRHITAVIHP